MILRERKFTKFIVPWFVISDADTIETCRPFCMVAGRPNFWPTEQTFLIWAIVNLKLLRIKKASVYFAWSVQYSRIYILPFYRRGEKLNNEVCGTYNFLGEL